MTLVQAPRAAWRSPRSSSPGQLPNSNGVSCGVSDARSFRRGDLRHRPFVRRVTMIVRGVGFGPGRGRRVDPRWRARDLGVLPQLGGLVRPRRLAAGTRPRGRASHPVTNGTFDRGSPGPPESGKKPGSGIDGQQCARAFDLTGLVSCLHATSGSAGFCSDVVSKGSEHVAVGDPADDHGAIGRDHRQAIGAVEGELAERSLELFSRSAKSVCGSRTASEGSGGEARSVLGDRVELERIFEALDQVGCR